jgi:hypothetical protein
MNSSPEASVAGLAQLRAWKNSKTSLSLTCVGKHDFLPKISTVTIKSLGPSKSRSSNAMGDNVVLDRPGLRPRNPAIPLIGAVFSSVETPKTLESEVDLSNIEKHPFARILRIRLTSGTVLLFAEPL